MALQKLTVGIFSREGQDNYKWLIHVLQQVMFLALIQYTFPVYISNNSRSITDALAQCQFAILYHTRKRGRLNITDVTDSLYDDELKDLASQLGNRNVVVVVDDLDDSSEGFKKRILIEQPLIKACARDLILISEMEKEAANLTGSDPRWSPPSSSQETYCSMESKIYLLKQFMEEALGISPGISSAKRADETKPLLKGNIQPPEGQPEEPNIRLQKRRNKRWLIIGGVSAILVIIIIIVLCLTLK